MNVTLPRQNSGVIDSNGRFLPEWYKALNSLATSAASASDNDYSIAIQRLNDDVSVLNNSVGQLARNGGTGILGRVGSSFIVASVADSETISLSIDLRAAKPEIIADLLDIPDSGEGSFELITRDAKGRVSGTKSGSTTDVPEGENLYFTVERAAAAAPVQEAPEDGGQYARQNGSWSSVIGYSYSDLKAALVAGANVTLMADDAAHTITITSTGSSGGGGVATVTNGAGISVDNTDPDNPVVALSSTSQASLVKADSALQPGANVSQLTNDAGYVASSSLAAVATSGSYNDLTNKPSIPAAQVNSDWNATSGVAAILNKPTLGTAAATDSSAYATAAQGSKADTALQTVRQGTNITIDLSIPTQPVINAVSGADEFAIAGGTSDALTGSFSPAVTTLADGIQFKVRAAASNTTSAPTFKADGTTARTITKSGGSPLSVGDIDAGQELLLRYNGAASTPRYELLNPASDFTMMQDAAPAASFVGQTWVNTINGKMYRWYADADSSQWVEFGPAPLGSGTGIDGGNYSDTYVGSPYAIDGGSY